MSAAREDARRRRRALCARRPQRGGAHPRALGGTAASERTDGAVSALLVTPPALADELPTGYPRLAELEEAGWLPVPDHPLPFATTVVLSEDDPLGPLGQVTRMATRWSAATVTAGPVGHVNPAAGLRDWPWVEERIERLLAA